MTNFSTTPLTELEAVNDLLAAIGESSVSTLVNATTVDVTQAIRSLSQVNREVQAKGWHFNSEWDVTLTLDSDGFLPVGSNVLSLVTPNTLATLRGQGDGVLYAYDLKNNTFVWTAAITNAEVIRLLEFEDLPQTARRYIVAKASRVFQEEIVGQVSAETVNRQEEVEAYADLLDDESERSGLNVGYGTADMINTTKLYRKTW